MQTPLVEQNSEVASNSNLSPQLQPGPVAMWRRWAWLALIVVVVIAASLLWLAGKKKTTAIAVAEKPSIVAADGTASLRLNGTTQAVETRAILAPVLSGAQTGTLTISHLTPSGSRVKRGDLLVEFDRQAQLLDFIDKQTQSDKLSGDVVQEQAKQDAAKAKDETELKVAEDALGVAKLEMQKSELMSKIDAEKAQETLDEARATLDQLKETFDLKRKAGQASVRILEIQRDRSREAMLHAEANAALMQVHSPIDGIVVLNTVWKGGSMGEVQEGDEVRPGVPFMQVVDPSKMEVQVSVNQQDLLALHPGQEVRIHLDAYPDLVCPGELEVIDPLGHSGTFSAKVRVFSALFAVKCVDLRLLPSLSAAVDLIPANSHSVAGNTP